MDQTEEITAEFKTEEIKQEAAVLDSPALVPQKIDLKSWIPMIVGLVTLVVMTVIAFRFWLAL